MQRRNMLLYVIKSPNTTRSFERLSMREKPSSHHMTVRNNTHVHHLVNICHDYSKHSDLLHNQYRNIYDIYKYVHVYIVRLLDPLGI